MKCYNADGYWQCINENNKRPNDFDLGQAKNQSMDYAIKEEKSRQAGKQRQIFFPLLSSQINY